MTHAGILKVEVGTITVLLQAVELIIVSSLKPSEITNYKALTKCNIPS